MKRFQRSAAAFTLMEIMLVVMIIAILASAAIGLMIGHLKTVKLGRAETDIGNISTSITVYESRNQVLPTSLKDLVEKPAGASRKWSQLSTEIPKDPWFVPYVLEPKQRSKNADFDLFSCGPDKKPHTEDDIGNW